MLAGYSSANKFLGDFLCTDVEIRFNSKPGHAHTAIGKSNTEWVCKGMSDKTFVSHISVGTTIFGSTTINECLYMYVLVCGCLNDK